MTERDYYAPIGKHYLTHIPEKNLVWEAKLTKTNALAFKSLMIHQEEKLLEAERVLAHKIADVGRLKKPFDGIVVVDAINVVIAIYYKPRATRSFEILVRDFLKEKYGSKRKSLTIERAEEIALNELYL